MNNNVESKQDVQSGITIGSTVMKVDVKDFIPTSNETGVYPTRGMALIKKVVYQYPTIAVVDKKIKDAIGKHQYFINDINYPLNHEFEVYNIGDRVFIGPGIANSDNKLFFIEDGYSMENIGKSIKELTFKDSDEFVKNNTTVTITEYFTIPIYEIRAIIK